jgi:hypothetical protein
LQPWILLIGCRVDISSRCNYRRFGDVILRLMTTCEDSISYPTSWNLMNGRCSNPPWNSVEEQTLQQISSRICNYSRSPFAEIAVSIPILPYSWLKRPVVGTPARPARGGRALCATGAAKKDIRLWAVRIRINCQVGSSHY